MKNACFRLFPYFVFGMGLTPASALHAKEVPALNPKTSAAQYISCIDSQNVTLVSAHRGGPAKGFPENALETLQATIAHGPMLLEVDIRETADGNLVLLHDNSLDRTSTGTGDIASYTLEELKEIRLLDNEGNETDFAIPTLKSVLDWGDERAIIQLDVKRGIDYAKVAQAVVDADAVDSVLLIAYGIEEAAQAITVNQDLNFAITIKNEEDINALESIGIPAHQIVAWTGVLRQIEKPDVWSILDEKNIPAAIGAMWHMENVIKTSNDPKPYLDLAKAGADIIAADYAQLAFDTLNSAKDLDKAIEVCDRNEMKNTH